jgi:hypothetical protein
MYGDACLNTMAASFSLFGFVRTTLQADGTKKLKQCEGSGQVQTRGICLLWFLRRYTFSRTENMWCLASTMLGKMRIDLRGIILGYVIDAARAVLVSGF